ncbi:hypothetical protein [Pseudofrankia sp. BMG5.37]|uniref:hypothetical protein n=1 Tax=Pseudofrankia sp. BMG5.37 TaxID=3050035 RepID=UPI002894E984|nr:hypothetical protein [Pseudofrankia sp. BMG5.37]MDT3438960.1 hypothetical protein [Pseudofrankia sp. BMG5.37]
MSPPMARALLRAGFVAVAVAAACTAAFGDRWETLAPVAVPAVLVGPVLPWRQASLLAGYTVLAAVLVVHVHDTTVLVDSGWRRIGHSVLLAAITVAAAAIRDHASRAN